VKTRRMNASLPASFWRQGQGSAWARLEPKIVSSDSSSHSQLTCRSCRFSAMSEHTVADPPSSPRSDGSPKAASPKAVSPAYTPTSDDDAEPLGLDKGEEFILIKVSQAKGKCWATFLNDNPHHACDGNGRFPLSTSIEEMLEKRRKLHEKLNASSRQQEVRSMSPYREDGFTMFTNLKNREQGEKTSPGLRQAAKSVDTDTWDPKWKGRSEVDSWGTEMYHHTQEFRADS
jgi:hypothetical protein